MFEYYDSSGLVSNDVTLHAMLEHPPRTLRSYFENSRRELPANQPTPRRRHEPNPCRHPRRRPGPHPGHHRPRGANARHISLAGDTYTLLLTGDQTSGRCCLIDMHVPDGGGPPPHRHDFEEMFTILEGQVEFTFRGQTRTVSAPATVNIPANAPHSFRNASGSPARMLRMCTPAGQDELFAQVGDRVSSRTAPPPRLSEDQITERPVLIGGAAGGVGTFAVRLAKLAGATVIGTASEGTFEFLRQLGAEPVAYGPGLADRVRARAPGGVTAATDLFGTEMAETALALGVPPERISTVAAGPNPPAGVRATGGIDAGPDALERITDAILAGNLTVLSPRSFRSSRSATPSPCRPDATSTARSWPRCDRAPVKKRKPAGLHRRSGRNGGRHLRHPPSSTGRGSATVPLGAPTV